MSQPIKISTGFGPTKTLQYIPKNTCIFPTKHTCTTHSMEEEYCRKRAWLSVVVSNRNPPRPAPFLLHAAAWKDYNPLLLYATWCNDEGINPYSLTEKSEENDELLTTLTLRILKLLMDYNNPMDGLGSGREILSGALQVWKIRSFEIDSNYCYLRLPLRRYHPSPPSANDTELTKGVLAIVMLLIDLNDPNDGLKVLNNALEVWNDILSIVEFDLKEEDKGHPFFSWFVVMACKIAFHTPLTTAEFTVVRSMILDE